MKNVALAAHDPGGANLLVPIIERFIKENDYCITILLLGPAKSIINVVSEKINIIQLSNASLENNIKEEKASEKELRNIIELNNIDLVFTATSYNCNLEKLLIRICKEKEIPSLSIIDAWSNYQSRFTLEGKTVYPDIIFTLDDKMKSDVQALFPPSIVEVCGNPHLYNIQEKYYRKRDMGQIKDSKTVRFYSDNFYYYYPSHSTNEFTIVDNIYNCLRENNISSRIIIKPHPLEDAKSWKDFIKSNNYDNFMFIENSAFIDYIFDNFIAIGRCTTALLETSLAGVPSFSYQIGFDVKKYFHIPLDYYGIQNISNELELYNILSYNFSIPTEQKKLFSSLDVIITAIDKLLKYAYKSI